MASNNSYTAAELFQAQAQLYRHMFSFLIPMSLKCALDLGIPDIIKSHGQPLTLDELVSALHVPQAKARCLQQLMRLLAHNGFFVVTTIINDNNEVKQAYILKAASEILVKGTDHCLCPLVQFLLDLDQLNTYSRLGKWICGEEPTIVETALGLKSYWEFINRSLVHLTAFNEAMECDSHMVRFALKDCKAVFEGLNSIVDVGGGTGNTAKIIAEAFPNLKCIVLDLPQVVEGLAGSQNFSFVGGNMFKSIPQADAVLMKCILHNWTDDDCIKILKKCKEAIQSKGKGGKLIIIDIVVDENHDDHGMTETKLFFDIIMMAGFNGKERDEDEWRQLFTKAGFKHHKILPIFGCRSLIEVFP